MSEAKIQFSKEEMRLLSDESFILTKNNIIRKVTNLLEHLQEKQQKLVERYTITSEVFAESFKISKGENYKGLPWVVLDHPRKFSTNDIFAIRTLFWWGKYFLTTLHLSGKYKNEYAPKLRLAFDELAGKGFHFCINDDQWQHELVESNYVPLSGLSAADMIIQESKGFVKIARPVLVSDIDVAMNELVNDYETILRTVC